MLGGISCRPSARGDAITNEQGGTSISTRGASRWSAPNGAVMSPCRRADGPPAADDAAFDGALKGLGICDRARCCVHRMARSPTRDRVIKAIPRRSASRRACDRQGVHILRHTFCSHLAMRGAPARAIQEVAGHADLSTTQRYMHLSPAATEDAIRLLDGRGSGLAGPENCGDILDTGDRATGSS